jgi:hypothetical protein
MNRMSALWRRLQFAAFAVLVWSGADLLLGAQPGPPQGGAQTEAAASPSYLPSYALVIFCLGIGLAIVLNSARRRDRAKPESYGEPK